MPRNRRKRHVEHHTDESWLIPYADMLTLLFALFIILFASSTIDAQKFEQLSEALSSAFHGGESILEHTSQVPPINPETNDDEEHEQEVAEEEEVAEEGPEEDLSDWDWSDWQELHEIQQIINAYIEDNDLQASLKTDLTEDGLLITILDTALFESGSANVKEDAEELAVEMSNLLVTDPPRHVTIAGHTDNVPIHNEEFRSNWDLSAMRAINFMQILLEHDDLDPERFSATGYGEYRPVESNNSADGRAQNRRVEVMILPRYEES